MTRNLRPVASATADAVAAVLIINAIGIFAGVVAVTTPLWLPVFFVSRVRDYDERRSP